MTDRFLGEIRMFPYNKIPRGWILCNGNILNIINNAALFSILSNRYGGDGKTTFALPDLRGRAIVGYGSVKSNTIKLGQTGGQEAVQLTAKQLPAHTHQINVNNQVGSALVPRDNMFAGVVKNSQPLPAGAPATPPIYGDATDLVPLAAMTVSAIGGVSAHNNMQPYIVTSYCICVSRLFPTRS